MVRQVVGPGRRLYVELGRGPGAPLWVVVARIEAAMPGTARYRVVRPVGREELELVELPAGSAPP